MRFDAPWFLLLLAVVPFAVRRARRHVPPSAEVSCVGSFVLLPRSRRQTFAGAPLWMQAAALVLLAVASARPQIATKRLRQMGKGIALAMVIDRSSSMDAAIEFNHRIVSRMEMAKRVFRDFVAGGGGLKGRGSDLIGVVVFAAEPVTICPLTFAHENVLGALAPVRVAGRGEDGTAIGDAVTLAAARLKMLDRQPGAPRGKVVVLITDGENNRGDMPVDRAAALAASWGVRVYPIGIFDVRRKSNPRDVRLVIGPNGRYREEAVRAGIDTSLGRLAAVTGGVYRSVQQGDALESIYREIDRLEKSDVPVIRHVQGCELYPYLALFAAGLLALEQALSSTRLRRVP